jgi:hypothetical protein
MGTAEHAHEALQRKELFRRAVACRDCKVAHSTQRLLHVLQLSADHYAYQAACLACRDGGLIIQRRMVVGLRNIRMFNLSEADIAQRDLMVGWHCDWV